MHVKLQKRYLSDCMYLYNGMCIYSYSPEEHHIFVVLGLSVVV